MDVALDQVDWRDARGRRVRLEIKDGGVVSRLRRPAGRSLKDWIVFASGKSNYYISKVLNALWSATAPSLPATLYMGLWTSALTAASTGATAGETTYGSYARVAVTANTTNFPLSVGGSAVQNATAITFPANTSGTPTITYFAVLDAATNGNLLYWGSITGTVIGVGDTPQVNIAGLTSTEA